MSTALSDAEKQKRYALRWPERVKQSRKTHYLKNKAYYSRKNKEWRENNKELLSERCKRWRKENPEKVLGYKRKWNISPKNRAACNARYKNNIHAKLRKVLSARLTIAIRRRGDSRVRNYSCLDLVGCSAADLQAHIQSLWRPGMSWGNYGQFGWHIDHIRPCSSFDLSEQEQRNKCFHYTNLQPLWAFDNRSKGNKWVKDQ